MTLPTSTCLATHRREFLRQCFLTAGAFGLVSMGLPARALPQPGGFDFANLGPLGEPDADGLCLPAGFSARVVAVSGQKPLATAAQAWHIFPDGGATFATPDGGWVYVSNSEVPLDLGGASALRFDRTGQLVDSRRILKSTSMNCAGGATPWGTWLSGEETPTGRVWECQPLGQASQAVNRPALGIFKHEAVAVDPVHKTLYLTEDAGDGRFYRFVCSSTDWPASADRPALKDGKLQVLRFRGLADDVYPPAGFDVTQAQAVEWVDVRSPTVAQSTVRTLLGSKAPGTVFKGGEGLWYFNGIVYFSTKTDNRIWAFDPAQQSLQAIYDFETVPQEQRVLSGVDNLTVSSRGDVLVAEDGGNMELCVLLPDGRVKVLLRLLGQDGSELTGPAFSPDGRRLYVNSQRGGRGGKSGLGITFEVTLPA